MNMTIPFLTSYDPPGSSEGTLDPLGLYQIADQLAVQLVPAVRERMQRIRFLTAMAAGTFVTEGLDDDPRLRDASPYLVWEWLVVEALIREMLEGHELWGVPGTLMGRRALGQYGYLDARSYLKTPRIFGFHGVYKRLAIYLGIVNVHLGPSNNTTELVDAWARSSGLGGLEGAKPLFARWSSTLRRSLNEDPPRTKVNWNKDEWRELAKAFDPSMCKSREKRCLRDLLIGRQGKQVSALPAIWELQSEFGDLDYSEQDLHIRLGERYPEYRLLLNAIRAYEYFSRSLQDAFDILKADAGGSDAQGFSIPQIEQDTDFRLSAAGLHEHFDEAYEALGKVQVASVSLQNLFGERFKRFAEPMTAGECGIALCDHHEAIQQAKSADGKRAWFDRIDTERIYIRHAYRESRREIQHRVYFHSYRAAPIRRFYSDLK